MDGEDPSSTLITQPGSMDNRSVEVVTSNATAVAATPTAVGQLNVHANDGHSGPVLRNLFDDQKQLSG